MVVGGGGERLGEIPPRPCDTIGASVAVAGLDSSFVDIFLFSVIFFLLYAIDSGVGSMGCTP